MKYISFAIPCYNSEAYMEKAINSILIGGEDVESSRRSKKKTEDTAMQSTADFLMPQENILK